MVGASEVTRKGLPVDVDRPAPTVLSHGRPETHSELTLPTNVPPAPLAASNAKPPFSIPSMAEVDAIPWNGRTLVSTFSGCGGSCLGFRMAGFRVLWASEFIPAARDTYLANSPDVPVDARDIREVTADDILSATGLKRGELDVLEGSPPCASFSTAGKRERGWGRENVYSDSVQRSDDLFFEFVRLIDGLQPKVFVAENVSGLVKGVAKGYFKLILRAMRDCGYRVSARLLDASWLGVPQMRQRVIFVGVRNDLEIDPVHPTPLPYQYSVRDAIPWIAESQTVRIEEATGFGGRTPETQKSIDEPASTVQASRSVSWIVEPEADISKYAIGDRYDAVQVGKADPERFSLKKPDPDRPSFTINAMDAVNAGRGSVVHPYEKRKFSIAELRRICGFPDDFVLTGTYGQQWERLGRAVPPVMMFHVARVVRDDILARL